MAVCALEMQGAAARCLRQCAHLAAGWCLQGADFWVLAQIGVAIWVYAGVIFSRYPPGPCWTWPKQLEEATDLEVKQTCQITVHSTYFSTFKKCGQCLYWRRHRRRRGLDWPGEGKLKARCWKTAT